MGGGWWGRERVGEGRGKRGGGWTGVGEEDRGGPGVMGWCCFVSSRVKCESVIIIPRITIPLDDLAILSR